jgi:hypothetical protein
MLGVLLVTIDGTAQAADPATHQVATWNMQVGSDRWQGAAVIAGRTVSWHCRKCPTPSRPAPLPGPLRQQPQH